MTQVSLYIALNNFVPLHCATWLLVPQTGQIHLPHNRWGRQIAQSGLGHGGKYRNIRLIHGSCQAGPGRDRSLFLDSLLADQSMEQSHSRRGGRAAHARSHTPQQSPASHTRGGRQGPGAAQVDWCSHTHHAAGGGRREATSLFWVSSKWSHSFPGCHRSRSPLGLAPSTIDTTDVHTATTTHLNFVQV